LQAVILDPTAGSDGRSHQSLESVLVGLAVREGNRLHVGGIKAHFHSGDEAPYTSSEIAKYARAEASRYGFLAGYVSAGAPLNADCKRIAQYKPRFDAVWERWNRFAAAEAPLHGALIADAASSVPGYWG
jgi:hypothetical protein